MSRSLWKPSELPKSIDKHLKIYTRNNIITKNFLNIPVKIHNGTRFFEIIITEKMLGHKFGEFAPTRKFPLHKKKKTILKKKK